MIDTFKKFVAICGRSAIHGLICIVLMGLVSSALELVGVGLVFPLIVAVVDRRGLAQIPVIGSFLGSESLSSGGTVMALLCGLAGVFFVKNIYLVGFAWSQVRFAQRLRRDVVFRLMRAYLYAPYLLHLGRNSAEAIRNIASIAQSSVGIYFVMASSLLVDVIVASVLSIALIATQPLALIAGGAVIACAILLQRSIFRPIFTRISRVSTELARDQQKVLMQSLGSIKETIVGTRENYFLDRANDVAGQAIRNTSEQEFFSRLPALILETALIAALVTAIGVILLRSNDALQVAATLGLLSAAAIRLLPLATRIVNTANTLVLYGVHIDILASEFSAFGDIKPRADSEDRLHMARSIELRGVSYAYPESPSCLNDVTLSIAKGEFIGIIGPSGAGKSTLADILLGLQIPQQGSLLIDGVPLSDLPAWRRGVGYVPQEVYILDESLRRNVAFGVPDAQIDDDRVRAVLELVQLGFLEKSLPEGLETSLGERGSRLSGGQRQRIGIARSLYGRPDVLVLDEPTSALDIDIEHEIAEVLNSLRGKTTIVVIAHRLRTVRDADRLILLRDGRLVDSGPLQVLYGRNRDMMRMIERSEVRPSIV